MSNEPMRTIWKLQDKDNQFLTEKNERMAKEMRGYWRKKKIEQSKWYCFWNRLWIKKNPTILTGVHE